MSVDRRNKGCKACKHYRFNNGIDKANYSCYCKELMGDDPINGPNSIPGNCISLNLYLKCNYFEEV